MWEDFGLTLDRLAVIRLTVHERSCSDLLLAACQSYSRSAECADRVSGMHSSRPVIVMELPEELSRAQVKAFLSELRPLLAADRPHLVLECTHVIDMDVAGVEMLLHCLEESMKGDGDLKLAAVSPALEATLQRMQVERLFEIFDTAQEAVQSFCAFQSRAGEPRRTTGFRTVEDSQAA